MNFCSECNAKIPKADVIAGVTKCRMHRVTDPKQTKAVMELRGKRL